MSVHDSNRCDKVLEIDLRALNFTISLKVQRSICYYPISDRWRMIGIVRILSVYLGNVIRSVLAEHLLLHLVLQDVVWDRYLVNLGDMTDYRSRESAGVRMRQVTSDVG
jgi:hypothetical protein